MWKRTVATMFQLLQNKRKDQIATKIRIEGRLDDPRVKVVAAIIGVLKNAFIKAVTPMLEDVVDIESIWKRTKSRTKGFLKSLFVKEKRKGKMKLIQYHFTKHHLGPNITLNKILISSYYKIRQRSQLKVNGISIT